MRRRHCTIAIVTVAVSLAACTTTGDDPAVVDTKFAHRTTSTAAPTPAPTTTRAVDAAAIRAAELCSFETTLVRGRVTNPAVIEASGLVASRRYRDVIWTHNDGGGDVELFAVGADGADLGVHPLAIDGVQDLEDIALLSGPDGDDLLLGDIGDNATNRPSIRIYRVAEPDPTSTSVAPITDIDVLEFVYPDRPHNAETLLVDEANRRIVVVTKEQQLVDGVPPELGPTLPSFVFEGSLDGHGDAPVELTVVGTLDTPLLETRTVADAPHASTLFGFGGLPTGGDVSPDGALVALRTYETIWLWSRLPDRSVAESLAADPCQVMVASERQGEAVAFFGGTLVTLSEGTNQSLFELGP